MSRLVHVVADYKEGEPAFDELVARPERVLGDVEVVFLDGGSAAERFGSPTTGAPIAVESRAGGS